MDPTAQFVADLTIAVVGAAIGGFTARLVRLSPIVGYLLAGVVIGPFTPGYVANQQTINNLAQLGVIFLLFSIGLGFSLAELKSFGRTAFLSNILVLPLLALAVVLAAAALHILHPITLALLSIVSSTAIGASLLKQRGLDEAKAGRLAAYSHPRGRGGCHPIFRLAADLQTDGIKETGRRDARLGDGAARRSSTS
jgi:CPA2 family monovalent cation:H+ antiporter-2